MMIALNWQIFGVFVPKKGHKQEILQKARQTAAGWSVFGEAISTLYFGLRSNKAVAKKYNLKVLMMKGIFFL